MTSTDATDLLKLWTKSNDYQRRWAGYGFTHGRRIKEYRGFVALTDNSETNILACLAAKRMGVTKTVAEVENIDYISMAESLDIGTVINKR